MESRIVLIRHFVKKQSVNLCCVFTSIVEVFVVICRLIIDTHRDNKGAIDSYDCQNATLVAVFQQADCYLTYPDFSSAAILFHSISVCLLSLCALEVAVRLLAEDWTRKLWQYVVPLTDTLIVSLCFIADIVFAFTHCPVSVKAFLLLIVFRFARLLPLCKGTDESQKVAAMAKERNTILKENAWLICECRRLKFELETIRVRLSANARADERASPKPPTDTIANFAANLSADIIANAVQTALRLRPSPVSCIAPASTNLVQSDSGYGSVRLAGCLRRSRAANESGMPTCYVNRSFFTDASLLNDSLTSDEFVDEAAEIQRVSSVQLRLVDQPSTSL